MRRTPGAPAIPSSSGAAARISRSWRLERELLATVRRMEPRGLVVGTVGNASVRAGEGLVITPTRRRYERLRRRDLVAVGLDGEVAGGRHAPSRELPLHLAVYRRRPDLSALVHTHSPCATAWSFLGEPLEPALEEREYYAIGHVRTAPRAAAGSDELAAGAARALGGARAVLLAGHGVLAGGDTPAEALTVAEAVEHQARVAWLLRLEAGGVPAGGAGALAELLR